MAGIMLGGSAAVDWWGTVAVDQNSPSTQNVHLSKSEMFSDSLESENFVIFVSDAKVFFFLGGGGFILDEVPSN